MEPTFPISVPKPPGQGAALAPAETRIANQAITHDIRNIGISTAARAFYSVSDRLSRHREPPRILSGARFAEYLPVARDDLRPEIPEVGIAQPEHFFEGFAERICAVEDLLFLSREREHTADQ